MTTIFYQEPGVVGSTAIKCDLDTATTSKVEVVEIVGPGPNFYQVAPDSAGRISIAGLTADVYPVTAAMPLTPQGGSVIVAPGSDSRLRPFFADLAERIDATNQKLNQLITLLAAYTNQPNPLNAA